MAKNSPAVRVEVDGITLTTSPPPRQPPPSSNRTDGHLNSKVPWWLVDRILSTILGEILKFSESSKGANEAKKKHKVFVSYVYVINGWWGIKWCIIFRNGWRGGLPKFTVSTDKREKILIVKTKLWSIFTFYLI